MMGHLRQFPIRHWQGRVALWPTLLLKPDARLAPEFVLLWCGLLMGYGWRGLPGRRALNLLAVAYLLLALGRYLDVSVPALFGRPVNLYWDGLQLPRFISVVSQALPGWGLIALVAAVAIERPPGGGVDPGTDPGDGFTPGLIRNGVGQLTLNFDNVPFSEALDLILMSVGLVKVDIR